jgi:lysylphosphatidylglycerol synthetase-like protein (DUF2156 family)
MTPAEGIRKLGFRRWYERQLVESHAWFITCFLCLILVLACAEDVGLAAGGWKPVIMLAVIAASAALGVSSLHRYRHLLGTAETIAQQSTCTRCTAYGRITVVGSSKAHATSAQPQWMRVQCRRCGNEWLIE